MKMLMAKLKIQPDTMEPLNDELNMEIANDIIWGNPDFKRKLKSVLKSKKWAYKSWHLYSPHIQNEGDYQYDFMRINKNLATNGASTNFEFPLWTMDSSKNPIEISRFANLANEFPLYAIDTSKMMKVLGYIKNFTPYDEELLHNLAMCNKSVFIYVQKNNPSSPNGKSKKGQQTMVYLYKKLFSFIEDLISKQDGPYDDEMTQGMHELSTQSRLKDDGAEDIQRPGEERLEQHAPLRNATSEPLETISETRKEKICLWNKDADFQTVYNDFCDFYDEYARAVSDRDRDPEERPVLGWVSISHSKSLVYKAAIYYLDFSNLVADPEFEYKAMKFFGDIRDHCLKGEKDSLDIAEEKNLDLCQRLEVQNVKVICQEVNAPRQDYEPNSSKRITNINLTGGKKIKVRMTGERVWKIKALQSDDVHQSSKKNRSGLKNLLKLAKPSREIYKNSVAPEEMHLIQAPPQTNMPAGTQVKVNVKSGNVGVSKNTITPMNESQIKGSNRKVVVPEGNSLNTTQFDKPETNASEFDEELDEGVVKRFPSKGEAKKYPEGSLWRCQYLYISINKECQIDRFCLFKNLDDFLEKFEIEG